MVPCCRVSRCQFPQFWWSRDVRSRVFSRPFSSVCCAVIIKVGAQTTTTIVCTHSRHTGCRFRHIVELPSAGVRFQLLHPSSGTACLPIFNYPPLWPISARNYRHTCSSNHFQTFCRNYPHTDFAFVDFVMTPVILTTLQILIWLIRID